MNTVLFMGLGITNYRYPSCIVDVLEMTMPAQILLPAGRPGLDFSVPIKESAFLQAGAVFVVNLVDVKVQGGKIEFHFNLTIFWASLILFVSCFVWAAMQFSSLSISPPAPVSCVMSATSVIF